MRVSGVSIDGLEFPVPAFLAPMAGITDRAFRVIAARFGAGMVVSEMIASAALNAGNKDMRRKLTASGGLPHVVQLAGCEPEWMEKGAKLAEDAGADMIDINFGCPAKRVTNGYAGSALMRVPDHALRIVEAVAGATSRPVSVKMRLGWDDDSLNAPEIAKLAVGAGAKMITVHGRTRQQFYKGNARWDRVKAVVDAVDVPVVVNGDILSISDAEAALAQSGAQAVMVGRAAQGNPWLVGQIGATLAGIATIPSPTIGEILDLVLEHYEAMLEDYGVDVGVRAARKHLDWYLQAAELPLPSEERKALLTCTEPAETRCRLNDAFRRAEARAA